MARICETRILNQRLVSDHGYTKYKAHIDFLEVLELREELGVQEFDTKIRPYIMGRAGDVRW